MSQYTPSNPYQPTSIGQDGHLPLRQGISGWTKAIFIIFIVFGVSGVIGGCIGAAQMVYLNVAMSKVVGVANPDGSPQHGSLQTESIALSLVSARSQADSDLFVEDDLVIENDSQVGSNPGDELAARNQEFRERVLREPFPGSTIVSGVILLISILISVGMVIGGIIGLQGKLFGLNLVRNLAGLLIPFKLVEVAFSSVFTIMKKDDILAGMQGQMANQPNGAQAMQTMDAAMEIGFYVGLGFSVIWGLALVAFYLSVFVHTGRPDVRANFQ